MHTNTRRINTNLQIPDFPQGTINKKINQQITNKIIRILEFRNNVKNQHNKQIFENDEINNRQNTIWIMIICFYIFTFLIGGYDFGEFFLFTIGYIFYILIIIYIFLQVNTGFLIFNMSWFCKVMLFSHVFPLRGYFLNKRSKKDHSHQMSTSINIFQTQCFSKIVDKFERLIMQYQSKELTGFTIFSIIIQCFKWQFITMFLRCLIESLLRLLNSTIILFLVEAVQKNNEERSYILSTILICSMFLVSIIQNNWYLQGKCIYTTLQSAITMICYKSISKLKQSTINNQQIGKILNVISCDFNNSENTFIQIFYFLVCPLIIVGSSGILVYSLGWLGLIVPLVITLNVYLQSVISKKTSSILEQLNVYKDERIENTQQVIEGIRYAKLYNYEIEYGHKIQQFRSKQSACYLKNWLYESLQKALISSSHVGLFITFVIIYYFNRSQLNLNSIFASLSTTSFMRMYIWCVQVGMKNLFELNIIFKRFIQIYTIKQFNRESSSLQDFQKGQSNLQESQQIHEILTSNGLQVGEIKFNNYCARWIEDGFQLKNVNLSIKPGKIYGIGGVIGSGKSTLLSAILKQIPIITSGNCQYNGNLAYVQQQPCLFAGTIQQNILFGMKWNEKHYREVLQNSCLSEDLKVLLEGDLTKVGEKGVTLSGGQKARISLARGLYSQADIYLLDDPLSGLDTKTNKYIFEKVLKGNMLKGKTIILVTHLMDYLKKCDCLLIMNEGEISNETNNKQMSLTTVPNKAQINAHPHNKHHQQSIVPKQQPMNQYNQVNFGTFLKFISYSRRFVFLSITFLIYIFSESIMVIYLRLLSKYNQAILSQSSSHKVFWIVLASLIISYLIFVIISNYMMSQLSVSCINKIHDDMLWGVIRSPLKFYDITSSSMLINKFSNDINIMDTSMISYLIYIIQGIIMMIVALINVTEILPFFLVPCTFSLILSVVWFVYMKDAVIYAQEQVLQCKTPLYEQILFLTQNLTQIHIYRQEQNSEKRMMDKMQRFIIQKNSSIALLIVFRLYLNYFSIIMTSAAILLGIKFVNNPGSYAMCIVVLVQIQDLADFYGLIFLSLQSIFVSVARCFSICGLETEADLRTQYDKTIGFNEQIEQAESGRLIKSNWPQKPTIEYKNFTMRYQSDLQPALKNINLKIEQGTKVAFIGRTGSGKSSMIQSLFRMYESDYQSQLFIGGCNAKLMGLRSLRNSLSIIPQCSFIFRGTIRENIDPFNQYSDEEVWKSVEECKLKECIQQLKQQINTPIDNDLETFSVGQKQLICLARVLIKNNKIVVLDEATSNIDLETQTFIHEMLKKKFKAKTIITIAHRLQTIADYDKVIVMQKGKIAEQGNLFKLLAISNNDTQITSKGMFAEMVKNTHSNGQRIFDIAKSHYLKNIEVK